MKKLVLVFALLLILTITSSVIYAEDKINDDDYVEVETSDSISEDQLTMSMEDIMNHSTIMAVRGDTTHGYYESSKMEAGLPGYKYTVKFDWTAAANGSGDYAFTKISNAKVTTHTNYIITGLTFAYSSYDLSSNTYSQSSDKRSITFKTTYDFEYMFKDTFKILNSTKKNTFTKGIDDLL